MKISYRALMRSMLAVFVIFLPRRLYLMGMYSYRVIALFILLLYVIGYPKDIKIDSFLRRPAILLYFSFLTIVYIRYSAFVSMAGYFLDTVILYLLMICLTAEKEDLKKFKKIFLWALFYYTILGITEFVTGFNIWNVVTGSALSARRYGLYRAFGSMSTPINNGFFLMLCMPVIMSMILNKETGKERKLCIMVYCMLLVNLICTLSRGPIIFGVVLNLIWLMKKGVLNYLIENWKSTLVVIFTAVCLMQFPKIAKSMDSFFLMFQAITDSDAASAISDSFGSNAKGVGERLELYEWVQEAVKGDLLMGKGPYQEFGYIWYDRYKKPHMKISIENQYLASLFRYGLIGMITMMVFFADCLYQVWKWGDQQRWSSEKLSIHFMFLSTIVIYYISLMTAAMAEEIKMFYILLAIYFMEVKFQRRNAIVQDKGWNNESDN